MYTTRLRVAAVSALLVTSLTAGCIGGLPVGGSLDADAVGEQVEQRYDSLDGYSATVTRTIEVGDGTDVARARVTVRGDRRDVTYTAGPRAGETVTGPADDRPVFGAALGVDGPATASGYGALAAALVASANVTVDRVTTVDGRRTAVVELEPTDAAASDLTRTVWVDLDRRIPTTVVTSWTTTSGDTVTVTVEYDDVTLYENGDAATAEAASGTAEVAG